MQLLHRQVQKMINEQLVIKLAVIIGFVAMGYFVLSNALYAYNCELPYYDNYHGFDFNATSNSDCLVKCKNLNSEYSCLNEAVPSFTELKCSCYIDGCRR